MKKMLVSPSRDIFTKKTTRRTTTTTTPKTVITNWNWVDKGVVGPVLNQKECGCCYAFVTVIIF